MFTKTIVFVDIGNNAIIIIRSRLIARAPYTIQHITNQRRKQWKSQQTERKNEKTTFTWLLILCTSLTLCPSISWSGFGANSTSWPVDINYHFIILSAPFTVYFPFSPWVKGPSPFDWRAHRQWERWRECTWRRRCGGRRGEPPNSPEKV